MLRAPIGLKTLRRLARRRSARTEAGCFVVEGATSVAAAVAAGHDLVEVFVGPDTDPDLLAELRASGAPITEVDAGRLDGIVTTRSPQPVAAVAVTSVRQIDELDPMVDDLVLVLVDVGDPGNVGTLLRVAEAAGASTVLCLGESADPFNPKAVRASAGSVFSVGVVVDKEVFGTVQALGAKGWAVTATSPRADLAFDEADLVVPTALVLGSEPHGLPTQLESAATRTVRIPMVGRAESLNVAMAGAVLCFEAVRQRRVRGGSDA